MLAPDPRVDYAAGAMLPRASGIVLGHVRIPGDSSLTVDEAEQELNSNRYDTDRPRNLAQQAKHNALHAIYVAGLKRRLRDDDT